MRLFRLTLTRLAQIVPLILLVVVVDFTLIHLAPGDIATVLGGENPDPDYIASVREMYGLDKPYIVQLFHYIGQVATGNLGYSFRSHQPVLPELLSRVPATLLLIGVALVIAVVIGTTIGAIIARRPGSAVDRAVSGVAVAFDSIPAFWLGLVLILVFAVWNRWLPTGGLGGYNSPKSGWPMVADHARYLVLPAATLAITWVGQYLRITRASVVDVMGERYITTVRAIGFPERRVLLHYALRNALLPVVTIIGLQAGLSLAGAVLTETVFGWPGLGRLVYEAIVARDTPVVVGAFILVAVAVAIASFVTDLVYAALDPRVRI